MPARRTPSRGDGPGVSTRKPSPAGRARPSADRVGRASSFGAAILLTLAGLTAGAQDWADASTHEQTRMFGSFYHDSIDAFFEVVGEELLAMPAEQFEALPQELQRSACLAIVDHTTYRSVMFKALYAAHAKQKMVEFMERAKEAQGFGESGCRVRWRHGPVETRAPTLCCAGGQGR